MKKSCGFTLAEVLITLGIIGVVAALTIPTLISNHQKKVYVNQLKKAYNTITNGFSLIKADIGSDNLFDSEFIRNVGIRYAYNEDEVSKYAKKYFNVADDVKFYGYNTVEQNYKYLFYGNGSYTVKPEGYLLKSPDGADIYIYGSDPDLEAEALRIYVYVDVNGANRAPNTVGRDLYSFTFDCYGKYLKSSAGGDPDQVCGGGSAHASEIEACAARIIEEGWEMNY